jgi:hypothetical protein
MEDNGLTPYQLQMIRDSLAQGGQAGNLKASGGLMLGAAEFPVSGGSLAMYGSIRDSTALGAGVYSDVDFNILSGVVTAVTFNQARFDTDSCWDPTNPTRLTANTAGVYVAYTSLAWWGNVNGARAIYLRQNGTLIRAQSTGEINGLYGGTEVLNCACVTYLDNGDYLEAVGWQNSGVTLGLRYAYPSYAPELAMVRVA